MATSDPSWGGWTLPHHLQNVVGAIVTWVEMVHVLRALAMASSPELTATLQKEVALYRSGSDFRLPSGGPVN